MPLFRLIILALIVGAGVYIYRRLRRKKQPQPNAHNESSEMADIVKCDACDLHIPKLEAVHLNNRYYCSPEHARQDR